MSADPKTHGQLIMQAAIDLVELCGFAIVPAHCIRADGKCSCGNTACPSPGKHPRGRWQETMLLTVDAVVAYWQQMPDANFGIATGRISGVVVVDVDGDVGVATRAELEQLHGAWPITPTVITPRGVHLYFAAGDVPLHNRQGAAGRGLGAGIDLRAEGGFVMAPPSMHPSGVPYLWAQDLHAGLIPFAPVMDFVVEHGRERAPVVQVPELPPRPVPQSRADKWANAALDREIEAVRTSAPGARNRTLNAAAFNLGMLIAGGALDGDTARVGLLRAALECGLSEFEAQKTVRSGIAAGMKKDARSAPVRDLPEYERMRAVSSSWSSSSTAAADGGGPINETYEPEGPRSDASVQPVAAPPPSAMVPRYDTAGIFAPLPEQRWVVPGLQIGPGRPALIVGFGASAKTISAQALALAVAAGVPIWGKFECSPMIVLHVDYEQGHYATAKRYQRLALGMGLDWRELRNRLHYIEMPRVYLDRKGGEEEYLRACEGVDLVIVDALRGVSPHTDENDSAFRTSIDSLTYCSQRTGVAGLLIHHAGKPKAKEAGVTNDARMVARGTSAIFDASGCVLNFIARPGEAARLVQQVKTPAEAEGNALAPFELLIEDVLIDGNATAGARVLWQKHEPLDVDAEADAAFERDAARLIRQIRKNPEGQTGPVIVTRCGMRKARGLDVLKALAESGRLELAPGASPRSKVYRLKPEGGVP